MSKRESAMVNQTKICEWMLEDELALTQERLTQWRTAMENLTPGGSEYHNDLARCVEAIQKRINGSHETVKTAIKERKQIEERLAKAVGGLRREPQDWIEDYADDDNGCYQHICDQCKAVFYGHKRRSQTCKVCWISWAISVIPKWRTALKHYADKENWQPSEPVTDDMDDRDYDRLPKDFYIGQDSHGYDLADKVLAEIGDTSQGEKD